MPDLTHSDGFHPSVRLHDGFERLSQRLSGPVSSLLLISLLIGKFGGAVWPVLGLAMNVAVVVASVLALLQLTHVLRVIQIMSMVAVLMLIGAIVWLPGMGPALWAAVGQGAVFSAFLITLGLLRGPVRTSRMIGYAAEALLSFGGKMQRVAICVGGQFLSVLFNMGTISILTEIAMAREERAGRSGDGNAIVHHVTLWAARGATLVTVWNPIGVGFAIVTTAIVGLNAVAFLFLSLAVTMALTVAGLVAGGRNDPRPDTVETAPVPDDVDAAAHKKGLWALALALVAVAVMIGLTVVLHVVFRVDFLIAAALILPTLAFLWPFVEPLMRQSASTMKPVPAMGYASRAMANEATIFFAAAIIGCVAGRLIELSGMGDMVASGSLPAIWIILGTMIIIPALSAMMIPHSIVMVLIAQVLGQGPVGAAHPMALALALCTAWCVAISLSPVSAISVVTARYMGESTRHFVQRVNARFGLTMMVVSCALVMVVYAVE